jgi:hypothetical protein
VRQNTASKTPTRPQTARSTRDIAKGTAHDDSVAEWLAGTAEAGRLGYAPAHPAGTDLVAVAHLREQVRRLDEQYDRSPAAALIAEAGQCLGQIGFLRVHARRADVRLDLCAAQAEAATLMGQLVWDASQRRDQVTTLAYYDQAVAAARSWPRPRGSSGTAPKPRPSSGATSPSLSSASPGPVKPLRHCTRRST